MNSILTVVDSSLIIFTLTTFSCLYVTFNKLKSTKQNELQNEKYLSILSVLFVPLKSVPKDSVSEVFEKRKLFFNKYWTRCLQKYNIDNTTNNNNNNTNNNSENHIKVIQVAGTKGKGSTVEYIASAIRSTNHHHIGVFTSPHLHTARERFKINKNIISINEFIQFSENAIAYVNETKILNEVDISWLVFFDYLILIATEYFLSYTANSNPLTTVTTLATNYIKNFNLFNTTKQPTVTQTISTTTTNLTTNNSIDHNLTSTKTNPSYPRTITTPATIATQKLNFILFETGIGNYVLYYLRQVSDIKFYII